MQILIRLEVCVGSGWGNVLFDYGKKFNDLGLSALYFNSFHFLSVFVLSLIGGLVWEVFDVVERIMRDQQAYEQQLEVQRKWEEQQQQIEASFQSSENGKKINQSSNMQRSSVRQSIRVSHSHSIQKLSMMPQKISKKISQVSQKVDFDYYDEDDFIEQDDGFSTQVVNQQPSNQMDEKQISKQSSNKQLNSIQNNMESNESEDFNTSSLDEESSEEDVDEETNNDENDNEEEDESSEDESISKTEQANLGQSKTEQFDKIYKNKENENKLDGELQTTESNQKITEILGNNKNQIQFKFKTNSNQIISQKKLKKLNQSNEIQQQDQQSEQSNATINNAVQKLKKIKKKQKKKRKNKQELSQIFQQRCLIDHSMMSQRDKSQIILFQDIFKLSTLDQFFKDGPLKPQIPNQNVSLLSQNSKFHTIREEEEEEYEQNGGSNSSFYREQKRFNYKKSSDTINPKLLIGIDEEEEQIDNSNQIKKNYNQDIIDQQIIKFLMQNQSENKELDSNVNKIYKNDMQKHQYIDKNKDKLQNKTVTLNRNNNFIQSQKSNFIQQDNKQKDYDCVKEDKFENQGNQLDFLSSSRLNGHQSGYEEILSERRCKSTGRRDTDQEKKYQQIRNSPIKNQNIIKQFNNSGFNYQLTENKPMNSNNNRSSQQSIISIDNQINAQLFKKNSDNFTFNTQLNDSSYRSYNDNISQNFSHNVYNVEQQHQINNQAIQNKLAKIKNKNQNQNITPQVQEFHNQIPKSNQTSVSKISSFGGIIIVDATQNTLSQNQSDYQENDSSESESVSHSIIKDLQQNEKKRIINKEKNFSLKYDFESEDSPHQKNQFPTSNYFPSKITREQQQEYLTEISSSEQVIQVNKANKEHVSKLTQSSQQVQPQRKSLFSKLNEDQQFKQERSMSSKNFNFKKIENSQQYFNYDHSYSENKISTDKLNNEQLKDNLYKMQNKNNKLYDDIEVLNCKIQSINKTNSNNNSILPSKNPSTQYLMQEDQCKTEINTIADQSLNFDHDLINNNSNFENQQNKIKTHEIDNSHYRSQSILASNNDYSECVFINNTFDESHNISLQQPQILMGQYRSNKDLKYINFKNDIDSSNISFNNAGKIHFYQQSKENLEQSFLEEMENMQQGVFQDEQASEKKQLRQKKKQQKQQIRDKFKQELIKYYKMNLIDMNQFNDNINIQTQNPYFQKSIGTKQLPKQEPIAIRDLIQDRPKNYQMKNHLLNINQDLRIEQQVTTKIDLNNKNFIINKAILKSVDQSKIEKIELRHFRQLYGKQFEDMLDNDIFPLWNIQAKLLFHFDNILKYEYIPIEQFIQIYSSLEMQVSSLLMNKFSSFKIIYQDNDDKWFTANFVDEAFLLQEVDEQGPWTFFESLFEEPNKNSIYKHRNIFHFQENNNYIKKNLKKYFQNSQDISNNYYFRKLIINQKRSDVVYIPFTNDNPDQIQKSLLDILQKSPNLPEYIKKEDLSLEMVPRLKRGIAIAYLFDNPNVKERKRQFTSDHINIEQAIVEEDIMQKEQLNATLNYTYSIELIRDMKFRILSNKDMLFKKIAQFYFYRACFERNFCSITEIPFEQ